MKKKKRSKKDGSVVIIRNKAKNADDTEFYIEKKGKDYAVREYAEKSALVGGGANEDEGPLETAVRELFEEFEDREAAYIIAKYAAKSGKYGTARIKRGKNDEEFSLDYFVAEVVNPDEWKRIKKSKLKGDGGDTKIVKLKDLENEEFIFGYERVLKKYIEETFGKSINFKTEPLDSYTFSKLEPVAMFKYNFSPAYYYG